MSNSENLSYSVYVKELREWVPCSEEFFLAHRRETDAFIHKMRSRRCCSCPKSKWWLCNEDCWTCEYHSRDEFISLEAPVSAGESEDITFAGTLKDNGPNIEELVCDKDELNHLLSRLEEMVPEACEVGQLRLAGMSDQQIAQVTAISRTTTHSRLKKAAGRLAAEYPDWF